MKPHSNPLRLVVALFFVWILGSLTGCAFTPRAVDGQELKPNQGLLVLKIRSNVNARLGFLDFAGESTFGNRFAENMLGPKGFVFATPEERYVVIAFDAGEYMWSKIEVYPMFAWLHASNKFKVAPNAITYIGDIRVNVLDRRFSLKVSDREHAMREYLASTYPEYVKSMPIVKMLAELRL
ncbi:hypothetical protein [Massilia pseudoviolaceinigra]|uniref:hypothetical protein n=1 Tax=Massilia pseudoviolaceinigra TaxID=3057165 RepID=UPI0027968A15|nr:hypothetical protein [Massilia sp. CCM 9206]MDQ1922539.1 hypothetical protein [Massilia sp. CCM 9206]